MARKTFAILVAAALIVGATAPGAMALTDDELDVTVDQSDDGSATATVTANGTAAANASVTVATSDENETYAGTGDYTADENGTVSLPAPNQTVSVDVVAAYENATANATVELVAENTTEEETDAVGNMTFGERVSALVHGLQNDSNTSAPFGLMVAQFAASQNPGNGQGPPAMAGPGGENETDDRGPPQFVGNDSDTQGPPEHAGNESGAPDDAGQGGAPDDAGSESGDQGPPEQAGGNESETGPPEHAGN